MALMHKIRADGTVVPDSAGAGDVKQLMVTATTATSVSYQPFSQRMSVQTVISGTASVAIQGTLADESDWVTLHTSTGSELVEVTAPLRYVRTIATITSGTATVYVAS